MEALGSWSRIRQWSRLFSEYAAAQAGIQFLGVMSGLLLVNALPVREYALYTFGLSIFTFVTVFSDLGATNALFFFRRQTRVAQTPFAPYVRAALRFRRTLLVFSGGAGLAFMAAVGHDRGFAAVELAATGVALVAAVWNQVDSSLVVLQLRLEGLYRESYVAELSGNAARLTAVGAIWAAMAPLSWLAMLTNALGSLVTRLTAASRIPRLDDESNVETAGHNAMAGIIRYVLPMSLSAAYFSIQAPLTTWLSAFFAGTKSVAEVGALGRLGLIFGVLSGFIGAVLIPRLSAVVDDAHYLKRYLQFWAVLLLFGVGVIGVAFAVPQWFLLLLPASYRGLSAGVRVVAISSVLSGWVAYVVAINNARGWVRLQPIALAIFAFVQIAMIFVVNLSSTVDVLYYGLLSNLTGFLINGAINVGGFLRPQLVTARQ